MTFKTTLTATGGERRVRRILASLALTLMNAWAPPGVMESLAPLWAAAGVLVRGLRGPAAA